MYINMFYLLRVRGSERRGFALQCFSLRAWNAAFSKRLPTNDHCIKTHIGDNNKVHYSENDLRNRLCCVMREREGRENEWGGRKRARERGKERKGGGERGCVCACINHLLTSLKEFDSHVPCACTHFQSYICWPQCSLYGNNVYIVSLAMSKDSHMYT